MSSPTLGNIGLFSLLPVPGGDRVSHHVWAVSLFKTIADLSLPGMCVLVLGCSCQHGPVSCRAAMVAPGEGAIVPIAVPRGSQSVPGWGCGLGPNVLFHACLQGLGRHNRAVASPARASCPQSWPASDLPPSLFSCSHCTTSPPTPGSTMRTSKCEYLRAAVQTHSGVGGPGWGVGSQFPSGLPARARCWRRGRKGAIRAGVLGQAGPWMEMHRWWGAKGVAP